MAKAPAPSAMGRSYGWFLELPVAFVLTVLWAAGAVLLCWAALALYLTVSVLTRSVAGIP